MQDDVASPIDLRDMDDAIAWQDSAMLKRPWRVALFQQFTDQIASATPAIRTVLELGSGPGFLAAHVLRQLPQLEYSLLDFSPAMHSLAMQRLAGQAITQVIERSFRHADWSADLGPYDCVVTMQAVHELRHKRHACQLHTQVRGLLAPGGMYLVCDHYAGVDGMANDQLYMSVDEQRAALLSAGFTHVEMLHQQGGLVLHRACH